MDLVLDAVIKSLAFIIELNAWYNLTCLSTALVGAVAYMIFDYLYYGQCHREVYALLAVLIVQIMRVYHLPPRERRYATSHSSTPAFRV